MYRAWQADTVIVDQGKNITDHLKLLRYPGFGGCDLFFFLAPFSGPPFLALLNVFDPKERRDLLGQAVRRLLVAPAKLDLLSAQD